MDKKEALKQIQEISQVIQSSNRYLFSGTHMILIGIATLLVPIIEFSTNFLTFNFDFGEHRLYLQIAVHLIFYVSLYLLIEIWAYRHYKSEAIEDGHPLIMRAFSIYKPILVIIVGINALFIPLGYGKLVFPIVFLLLGILYNILGRFSLPIIHLLSWGFILAAFLYVYLASLAIAHIWVPFVIYLGISYIVMGIALNKAKTKNA